MKIGARVLKTGLSITLSIIFSMWLIPDNSASLAAIAAVSTTAPSVKKSMDMFIRRLGANTIGGIVAVLMAYTIGTHPVATGLACIILIALLNYLKWGDVLTLAVITCAAVMVMGNHNDSILPIATYRVLETFIGVTVSFGINSLVYPPRYDQKFYDSLTILANEIIILLRASLRSNISFSIMHKDIVWARKEMQNVQSLFGLIKNEIIFTKKERMVIARRLVIYRHMIRATQASIELLASIHNNEHIFATFPHNLRLMIRERVEILLAANEQILMKFSGRVSAEHVNFMTVPPQYREEYVQNFFNQALVVLDSDELVDEEMYGIIHIMSSIYSYEEAIYKLNNIISIYSRRYRVKENIIEDPLHS